ncbi:hypothetical protein ACFL5G_01015 [Candidatus Margulisiibacteriota bacterium]
MSDVKKSDHIRSEQIYSAKIYTDLKGKQPPIISVTGSTTIDDIEKQISKPGKYLLRFIDHNGQKKEIIIDNKIGSKKYAEERIKLADFIRKQGLEINANTLKIYQDKYIQNYKQGNIKLEDIKEYMLQLDNIFKASKLDIQSDDINKYKTDLLGFLVQGLKHEAEVYLKRTANSLEMKRVKQEEKKYINKISEQQELQNKYLKQIKYHEQKIKEYEAKLDYGYNKEIDELQKEIEQITSSSNAFAWGAIAEDYSQTGRAQSGFAKPSLDQQKRYIECKLKLDKLLYAESRRVALRQSEYKEKILKAEGKIKVLELLFHDTQQLQLESKLRIFNRRRYQANLLIKDRLYQLEAEGYIKIADAQLLFKQKDAFINDLFIKGKLNSKYAKVIKAIPKDKLRDLKELWQGIIDEFNGKANEENQYLGFSRSEYTAVFKNKEFHEYLILKKNEELYALGAYEHLNPYIAGGSKRNYSQYIYYRKTSATYENKYLQQAIDNLKDPEVDLYFYDFGKYSDYSDEELGKLVPAKHRRQQNNQHYKVCLSYYKHILRYEDMLNTLDTKFATNKDEELKLLGNIMRTSAAIDKQKQLIQRRMGYAKKVINSPDYDKNEKRNQIERIEYFKKTLAVLEFEANKIASIKEFALKKSSFMQTMSHEMLELGPKLQELIVTINSYKRIKDSNRPRRSELLKEYAAKSEKLAKEIRNSSEYNYFKMWVSHYSARGEMSLLYGVFNDPALVGMRNIIDLFKPIKGQGLAREGALGIEDLLEEAEDMDNLIRISYRDLIIISAAVVGAVVATAMIAAPEPGSSVAGVFLLKTAIAALGATIGQEGGKMIVSVLDHRFEYNFNIKEIGINYLVNFGMMLIFMGLGHAAGKGLQMLSGAKVPLLSSASGKLVALANHTSKLTHLGGFKAGEVFVVQFAKQTGGEVFEEIVEETAQRVHPVLGFFASTWNSMDGVNVGKVQLADLNMTYKNKFTKIEGGKDVNIITYEYAQGKTERLITELKKRLGKQDFEEKVTVDKKSGRVICEITDSNGKTYRQIFDPTQESMEMRTLQNKDHFLLSNDLAEDYKLVRGEGCYLYTDINIDGRLSLAEYLMKNHGFVLKTGDIHGDFTLVKGNQEIDFKKSKGLKDTAKYNTLVAKHPGLEIAVAYDPQSGEFYLPKKGTVFNINDIRIEGDTEMTLAAREGFADLFKYHQDQIIFLKKKVENGEISRKQYDKNILKLKQEFLTDLKTFLEQNNIKNAGKIYKRANDFINNKKFWGLDGDLYIEVFIADTYTSPTRIYAERVPDHCRFAHEHPKGQPRSKIDQEAGLDLITRNRDGSLGLEIIRGSDTFNHRIAAAGEVEGIKGLEELYKLYGREMPDVGQLPIAKEFYGDVSIELAVENANDVNVNSTTSFKKKALALLKSGSFSKPDIETMKMWADEYIQLNGKDKFIQDYKKILYGSEKNLIVKKNNLVNHLEAQGTIKADIELDLKKRLKSLENNIDDRINDFKEEVLNYETKNEYEQAIDDYIEKHGTDEFINTFRKRISNIEEMNNEKLGETREYLNGINTNKLKQNLETAQNTVDVYYKYIEMHRTGQDSLSYELIKENHDTAPDISEQLIYDYLLAEANKSFNRALEVLGMKDDGSYTDEQKNHLIDFYDNYYNKITEPDHKKIIDEPIKNDPQSMLDTILAKNKPEMNTAMISYLKSVRGESLIKTMLKKKFNIEVIEVLHEYTLPSPGKNKKKPILIMAIKVKGFEYGGQKFSGERVIELLSHDPHGIHMDIQTKPRAKTHKADHQFFFSKYVTIAEFFSGKY